MRSRLKGLGLGLFIGLLGGLVLVTPPDLEEQLGLYWLFHLRGPVAAPPEVVVVAIDQPSAERLGLPAKVSEWPRSIHAELIDSLSQANASVIAFDLTFNTPSRDPQHDLRLIEAMRNAAKVVVFESVRAAQPDTGAAHELIPTIAPIAGAVRARAPFVLPKVSRVNEVSAFKADIGSTYEVPTMPVVVLQIYGSASYEAFLALLRDVHPSYAATLPPDRAALEKADLQGLIEHVRHMFYNDPQLASQMREALDSERFRHLDVHQRRVIEAWLNVYDGEEKIYVNFYGPPRTVRTLPYSEAVRPGSSFDLQGAAVFVGYSALTLAEQDQIRDDYHTVFSMPNGVYVSGVEIAATAFANLLHSRPIKPLPLWASLCVLLIWGVLLAVVWHSLPNPAATAVSVLLAAVYVWLALYLFEAKGLWLALAIPLVVQLPLAVLSGVYGKYRESRQERRRLQEGASRYLPKRVIDEILQNVKPAARNQILFGVCLATDADQYTTLAEKMEQRELTELMNAYYAVLFAPVQRHGGIVSDVVGDSMFAVWAAETPDLDLRKRACEACLDIAAALEEFNKGRGEAPLLTRLGLHCGEILLGSIGADQHFEYRAVGDTVNTASRIQGLNKYLGTRSILSAQTAEGLDAGYLMRPLGAFLLVGKSTPVEMVELVGRTADATGDERWICRSFAEALAAYRGQDWARACGLFRQILDRFPEDGPTNFYHTLCGDYGTAPPAQPWQPIVRMAGK
jgi:adenylate cyclase